MKHRFHFVIEIETPLDAANYVEQTDNALDAAYTALDTIQASKPAELTDYWCGQTKEGVQQ